MNKTKETIEGLYKIVTRWSKSQEIQKKDPKHYKLYKKTIDEADKEIQAIRQAIQCLEALDSVEGELPEKKKPLIFNSDKIHSKIEWLKMGRIEGSNQAIDIARIVLAKYKLENEELEKSKLTKEEFRSIACEYIPGIAEDSEQPEWSVGELDKLWEGLTKGYWLYINRDQQIEKLKLRIEELEKKIGKMKDEGLYLLDQRKNALEELQSAKLENEELREEIRRLKNE